MLRCRGQQCKEARQGQFGVHAGRRCAYNSEPHQANVPYVAGTAAAVLTWETIDM
jgi:hypothetical protein